MSLEAMKRVSLAGQGLHPGVIEALATYRGLVLGFQHELAATAGDLGLSAEAVQEAVDLAGEVFLEVLASEALAHLPVTSEEDPR